MDNSKTILIVDDVEINRAVLMEIFKDEYKIIEAEGGRQAIEIIRSGIEISAVLLDLLMPEVNGLDVLRDMNENGKIESIPVFLITAADSEEMLMEAYDMTTEAVITKLMWLMGMEGLSKKEFRELFYQQINYDILFAE